GDGPEAGEEPAVADLPLVDVVDREVLVLEVDRRDVLVVAEVVGEVGVARAVAVARRPAVPAARRPAVPAPRPAGAVGARALLLVRLAHDGGRRLAEHRADRGDRRAVRGRPRAAQLVAVRSLPRARRHEGVELAPERRQPVRGLGQPLTQTPQLRDVRPVHPAHRLPLAGRSPRTYARPRAAVDGAGSPSAARAALVASPADDAPTEGGP